jgi:hypothetical protein
VLVLPDEERLTPEIAARLLTLVQAGAILMGPRPLHSPSLTDQPAADATVKATVAELWGAEPEDGATDRRVGRGRVVWGRSLEQVLREMDTPPDVQLQPPAAPVRWVHRSGPGWDLYFLSNQADSTTQLDVTFRVSGRRPQLCDPDTGEVENPALWTPLGRRTRVSLSLDPSGSAFVLFAEPASVPPITAISGAGREAVRLIERGGQVDAIVPRPGAWRVQRSQGGLQRLEVDEIPAAIPLEGPWQVRFAERLDQPVDLTLPRLSSWTEQTEASVKYYSGTALYRIDCVLPAAFLRDRPVRVLLDLGTVHDLVAVTVNARAIRVLWKPPFVVDITDVVRPGRNALELAVTNTWRNRLIGDFDKPESERRAFVVPRLRKGAAWLPGGPDTVLSPAGMLGPACVRFAAVVRLG